MQTIGFQPMRVCSFWCFPLVFLWESFVVPLIVCVCGGCQKYNEYTSTKIDRKKWEIHIVQRFYTNSNTTNTTHVQIGENNIPTRAKKCYRSLWKMYYRMKCISFCSWSVQDKSVCEERAFGAKHEMRRMLPVHWNPSGENKNCKYSTGNAARATLTTNSVHCSDSTFL